MKRIRWAVAGLALLFSVGCGPNGLFGDPGGNLQPVQNHSAAVTPVDQNHPTSPTSNKAGGAASQSNKSGGSADASTPTTPVSNSAPVYPTLYPGTKSPAVLRLQQLLSGLGYLPLTWKASPSGNINVDPAASIQTPPGGSFAWRYSQTPTALQAMWNPTVYTVMTKGAVMQFETVHHLQVDGIAGPQVWTALLQDSVTKTLDPYGYAYVSVRKSLPETLTLWYNGHIVLSTRVNTGISSASTPNGTWPVYLRYRTQTMTGRTPSGETYSDPGVPYVSYFYGGCAVHGFIRESYGSPQSLGCVELPITKAAVAWKYMNYGTLVTVTN